MGARQQLFLDGGGRRRCGGGGVGGSGNMAGVADVLHGLLCLRRGGEGDDLF